MNWIDKYQSPFSSPFGWVQGLFIKLFTGENAMQQEQDHYDALIATGATEFEVISYLYDRLNIIDSKAQSILTINTIVLGALTISFQVGTGPSQPGVAIATYACSAAALFFSFAISRLRFDHMGALETYKKDFFKITIARQVLLSVTRAFTTASFVLFSILLISALSK